MFETIVIRRHDANNDIIDAGRLAEALLFYRNVHLLLDSGGLTGLLKQIGPDTLLGLLKDKRITVSFVPDILGTHTETLTSGAARHKFVTIRFVARADGRKIRNRDRVRDAFGLAIPNRSLAKAKADKFLMRTEYAEYAPEEDSGGRNDDVALQATSDLMDLSYVRSVIETTLKHELPSYRIPNDWAFKTSPQGREFSIQSNLPLSEINQEYRRAHNLNDDRVTLPWLVGQILEVRGDLHFAAKYMAELATDSLRAELIQLKFDGFLRRRFQSSTEIATFQTMRLESATAIRQAINSGTRTFSEFLKLLDKAEKFKDWLAHLNPDAKLINEYYRAATADSWIEKLQGKASRFVVFTLGGAAADLLLPTHGLGTSVGISAGAFDAFWVDRLLNGWRPNQFVEGRLKRFVDD